MAPAIDVCFPIASLLVANRQINEFQIHLGRTEYQVKVTERIKITKVTSILSNTQIVLAR